MCQHSSNEVAPDGTQDAGPCVNCGLLLHTIVDLAVDHPNHYTFGSIEVIDAITAWGLDFSAGNAVKYIARAKHKQNELQDLKKARWYLNYMIEQLEKSES
jgi:hypothetical protein